MSGIPCRRRRWLLLSGVTVAVLAGLGYLLAGAVERVRDAADRITCNLGGLRIALYNYQDTHGGLPPAILHDKDGRPLHSWRVLILPFIEETQLYEEFRLDEPWDSPHNLALLQRMPKTYGEPRRKLAHLPPYHTVLHVFVGRDTLFEERALQKSSLGTLDLRKEIAGRKIPADDEDQLLFVEAGEPVPWTKPQELPYDPNRPLPELRGLFRDGFRACLNHNSHHFIRYDTDEAILRALITRKVK
jgi:hypothetical protein